MAAIAERNVEESQQQQSSTQRTESQPQLGSSPVVMPQKAPSTPPQQKGRTPSSHLRAKPRRLISPLRETQDIHPQDAQTTVVDLTGTPDQGTESNTQVYETTQSSQGNGVKRCYEEFADQEGDGPGESQQAKQSFVSTLSIHHSLSRREAYYAMLENASDGWAGIGLLSTDGSHTVPDEEL